jgi:DNA-binding winged helix-turn-helix (wHTH) protein/Tol biopolymer transport system component
MNQDPQASLSGQPNEYLFGAFRLDVVSLQLWRGNEVVALTPKAFDTLMVLIRNRPRLVRKDELISAVWGNSFVSEDSLTQNVTALRRAFGDDPHHPEYITTVPRRGYRFIAPVTERFAPGTEPLPLPAPAPAREALTDEPTPAASRSSAIARLRTGWTQAWIPIVLAAAVGLGYGWLKRQPAPTSLGSLRFTIQAPPGTRLASGGTLSPDNRHIAFIAVDDPAGVTRLWVQDLNEGEGRAIEGTEGSNRPFWSPDSQSIGFFAGGRLKRVAASGGPVQTLASTVGLTVSGGTWGTDDIILFASFRSGINSVPASGGEVGPMTALDPLARDTAHRWPQFLPDGRRFIFSIYSEDPERTGTYISEVGSTEWSRVTPSPGGVYAPPEYILFVNDRVLMAQAFDLGSRRTIGAAVPVASDVFPPTPTSGATISASSGGLLSFGGRSAETQLVWFTRSGQALGTIKTSTTLHNPSLSSDGRYLLAGSGTDVWLTDLQSETTTRVVPGNTPLLSPDAAQIAFTSGRINGISDVYVRPTSGPAQDELLLRTTEHKIVNDWSRDGQYLVYASTNPDTKMDLWAMRTSGSREPTPLLVTPFNEFQAQVSPDGRWLAYASDESGTWEVYVQSFPVPGAKRAVSTGGGSEPQWRPDGGELFYVSSDGTLMAVDVQSGSALQLSRPRVLFRTAIPISGDMNTRRNHYAASSDGQRFLISVASELQRGTTVLVNWTARLPQ